jgi:GT2 family glycosyltransferase
VKYKVWAITLCYNDADIIIDSLNQYRATSAKDEVETHHILVNQHWPVKKEETTERLEAYARENGMQVVSAGRNLGLSKGFNYALERAFIPNNAMVIGYDGDSWPVTPGWDLAMCDVFMARPQAVWFSLWHPHAQRELITEARGAPEQVVGGYRTHRVKSPVMNSVCGFRAGWLKDVGGLYETGIYGGLECAMWDRVKDHEWLFLKDYKEDLHFHDRVNPLYREYKWRYAHVLDIPRGMDFESWLKTLNK